MSNGSQSETDQDKPSAANLAKDVHWITHATFWTQVGLGIIGIVALWIYHGQLVIMRGQLDQMSKQFPMLQESANAAKKAQTSPENKWRALLLPPFD